MKLNKRHIGANLAILATVAVMIIGFLGISIFIGLQAYMQGEVSKAALTAAMSGASVYYSGNPGGLPSPDATRAKQVAKDTFDAIVANSGALKGFGLTLSKPISNNDSSDSITVEAKGTIPTPFLAPVGIKELEITQAGTARALKYVPTDQLGPISISPSVGNTASASRFINLRFPIVDGPGTELYIEQPAKQAYAVEACNKDSCYDITRAARPVGGGRLTRSQGADVIFGSCTIDLAAAKVNKASKLRITHGNSYSVQYGSGPPTIPMMNQPLLITRVMIYGFAGACAGPDKCPVPLGFEPVE